MKESLFEAFEDLNKLDDVEMLNASINDIEKIKAFRDGDSLTTDFEKIIDPQAESEEDVKSSYLGKIILKCPVCHSLVYRDLQDIIANEEEGFVNVGDECPMCRALDGFKVVGEVTEFEDDDFEKKVKFSDMAFEEDGDLVEKSEEAEEESVEEGLLTAAQNVVGGVIDGAKSLLASDEGEKSEEEKELLDEAKGGPIDFDKIMEVAKKMRIEEEVERDDPDDEADDKNIINKLNKVLEFNEKRKDRGQNSNFQNVMLIGPPGSGKIAMAKEWAKQNNINLVTIKASRLAPEDIGGVMVPDPDSKGVTKLTKSTLLDSLDKPRSVLLLDDFDRANSQIRDQLLEADLRKFNNLLFIIVAVNDTETLNAPELSRFRRIYVNKIEEELERDDIDAEADDRKERARKRFMMARDAADVDKDYRLHKAHMKTPDQLKESDEPAAEAIRKAQEWVDYDIKRYKGKISETTKELVKRAGFQILEKDGKYIVASNDKALTEGRQSKNPLKESYALYLFRESDLDELGFDPVDLINHDGDVVEEFDELRSNAFDWDYEEKSTYAKVKKDLDTALKDTSNRLWAYEIKDIDDDYTHVSGDYFEDKLKEILKSKNILKESKKEEKPKKKHKQTYKNLDQLYSEVQDSLNKDLRRAKLVLDMKADTDDTLWTYLDKDVDGDEVFKRTLKKFGLTSKKKPFRGKIEFKVVMPKDIEEYNKQMKAKHMQESVKRALARKRLAESFNRVNIETDSYKMDMVADEGGKVTVTTEPIKKEVEVVEEPAEVKSEVEIKDEIIEPLSDETKAEIEMQSDETDYEDIDFNEIDEETFDRLGENYLKRNYSNVQSFKTTDGSIKGNTLMLEGLITFKSGKQAKTQFMFESKSVTSKGKVKFIGENKNFARGKKSFTLTGNVKDKKLVTESLSYNHMGRDAKTGKSKRLYGKVSV